MRETETIIEADDAWRRPSPRLRALRRVEVVAATSAIALLTVAIGVAGQLGGVRWLAVGGGAAFVLVLVMGLLGDRFAQRRARAWAYCERADDLLVRRGVLITRLSVVPYGRMQFIDVVAGPIERAFGLATVRMHTAAAASDARIPGLSQNDAARLRDHLAELGEAKAAGL